MSENNRFYKRGSLLWPFLLIGLGVIFLLNNLGVLGWDIWMTIIRLWPILLVVIGLDILLGRRSGVWSIIAVVIMVSLFAGGAWLVQSTRTVWSGEISTITITHPIKNSSYADINIDFSIGELEIGNTSATTSLIEGTLDITEDEELYQEYYVEGKTAFLDLNSSGTQYYPSWIFRDQEKGQRKWAINLTDEIPIDLNIDTGVGLVTIDLDGLQLDDLNIDSGIGETVVFLPESGSFNARISLGIGELRVYVPEDLMVRIHLDTGLGDNSISGDYLQSGNVYLSPEFDDSSDWVELYVDGGIGEVRVVQVKK